MEEVRKKICLEQFYSRHRGTIPFAGMRDDEFYPALNWGRIPYGVDFPKLAEEPESVELYGEGITKLGVLSYRELMSEYYRAVNEYGGYGDGELTEEEEEDVEKLKSIVAFMNSKIAPSEPNVVPDPCCDPCFVPSPMQQPDFDDGDYYVEPYANVDLCLVQSCNLVGSYTFATKDWVPGRRYFSGDKVIYDGMTFRLKQFEGDAYIDGSVVDCSGSTMIPGVAFYTANTLSAMTEYGGFSERLFDDFIINNESEAVDFGLVYAKMEPEDGEPVYFIRPSWSGYHNGYDGLVYFDVLEDDMNPGCGFTMTSTYDTEHWEIVENVVDYGERSVSGCGGDVHIEGFQERHIGFGDVTLTGISWESKLVNFKRNTKTVSVQGAVLPGKMYDSETSTTLDLEYLIGTVKNIDTTGEVAIGDYLADITVIPDHNYLISIFHLVEGEPVERTGRTPICGDTYTYYDYSDAYSQGEPWHLNPDGGEPFKGSIYVTGNSFMIYDEFGGVVFDSETDMPEVGNKIIINIGDTNVISHEHERTPHTTEHGETVDTTPYKRDFSSYELGISQDTSCNGEGFRIQPTAATENDYDIIADELLAEYSGDSKYIEFQTLDTYEKMVNNWATETFNETGWIVFKYFIGAELELERNDDDEVEPDAGYIYNGGERRNVYEDRYRFTARTLEAEIENENGDAVEKTFVYLDIDYESAMEDVVLENIDNYETRVIKADITAVTQSLTESGSPVSVNFQNADYFMEDYQIGLSFVANNNEDVYIDRGTATAFERHLRLSEVDTLDDIENYGNGMFKMKE